MCVLLHCVHLTLYAFWSLKSPRIVSLSQAILLCLHFYLGAILLFLAVYLCTHKLFLSNAEQNGVQFWYTALSWWVACILFFLDATGPLLLNFCMGSILNKYFLTFFNSKMVSIQYTALSWWVVWPHILSPTPTSCLTWHNAFWNSILNIKVWLHILASTRQNNFWFCNF